MTIYKFSAVDKKPEKKDEFLDVVTIPLTDDQESQCAPRPPALILVRPRRSRVCANVIAVFLGLIVLAAGIIGGIYLYKHLVHKASYGVCGVRYMDRTEFDFKPESHPESSYHYMEESVEVTNDRLEKIEVPRFDESEKSLILHDFTSNYTAIVDKDKFHCFIMKLNRTLVAPPKDLLDLIWKLRRGYYMPDAIVIRQKYRVTMPPMQDLSELGPYIKNECDDLNTYKLEHIVGDRRVWKRNAVDITGETFHYAFVGGKANAGRLDLAKFEIVF